MAKANHSGLLPDALKRIELAREKAHSIVAAAQAQAYIDRAAWLNTRISPDRDDLLEAAAMTSPMINEGCKVAMFLYFGAMAYEHYLITSAVAAFEQDMQDLTADVASEFSGNADLLSELKQQWVARASGREAVETPTSQRALPEFWQELGAEFAKLDGADLRAVLKDDGWWGVSDGPTDPGARQVLTGEFGRLIRRGMAGLGFYDRRVAVDVWLDILLKESSHASDRSIDHLSFACSDYCTDLAIRSAGAQPVAKSPEPDSALSPQGQNGTDADADAPAPDLESLIDSKEYVNVLTAARYLTRNPDHVRRLVRSQKLVRIGQGRPIKISTKSLKAYKGT